MKVHTGIVTRFISLLFVTLFVIHPASAETVPPAPAADRAAVMGRCAEAITAYCLIESIQTYLVPDQDQFRRERIMQALASAQLFDGKIDQAMASYRQLTAATAKVQFLTSYARVLSFNGDKENALKSLREANALVSGMRELLAGLDATGQRMSVAKAFAEAGSPEEGRAVLAEIAGYRHRIPMNPMLLALILQVAKSQAEIGFKDDATLSIRESYEKRSIGG